MLISSVIGIFVPALEKTFPVSVSTNRAVIRNRWPNLAIEPITNESTPCNHVTSRRVQINF